MNIDLVMWTLNGAKTLDPCLSSIQRSVPDSRVCHRIMVDGGSIDETRLISERYGWEFLPWKRGIGEQANYALTKVDTPLYGSFEQDILLSKSWLPRMERLIGGENVAVAQGLRLSEGSRPIQVMERWNFEHDPNLRSTVSIDNNLNKTDFIRELGGYPLFDAVHGTWPDGILWNKVHSHGFEWLIDADCISGHLRPSYWSYVKHFIALGLAQGITEPRGRAKGLRKLLLSPLRGAQIASRFHTPSVFPAYPVFRSAVTFCQFMQRETDVANMSKK